MVDEGTADLTVLQHALLLLLYNDIEILNRARYRRCLRIANAASKEELKEAVTVLQARGLIAEKTHG